MTMLFPSPDFDDAVAAVCHGTATEEQMRALNVLLRGNPAARDEYLIRVELHSRLASDPDLFQPAEDAGARGIVPGLAASGLRGPSAPVAGVAGFRRALVPVLALATCLVLIAGGLWEWSARRGAREAGATSAAVAMLTRAVNAHWGGGRAAPRVGGPLEPGTLRLEAGLAQVVFYSGARVVLEGPAELQVVSPSEAVCLGGRLLAEVPAPARGFRLRTPELNVVDLGTSFGIDESGGRTEVHVFKGKIEFFGRNAPRQPLAAGRAAAVRGTGAPSFMAASEAAFNPMFELQQLSSASQAVRFDQWRVWSARLNADPSLLVHLDFENPGDSDWALRNLAGGNRSVPEATVVGCQPAEGRWPEKQALEFQSVNDRVRFAVPGEFDSLTLCVWVRLKGLDRQFNSLFMTDGFAAGAVHWLVRQDGVLGLTVFGTRPREFQVLASPPVVTPDLLGMWTHLAVTLDGKAGRVVHYLNGVPVARCAVRLQPPYRAGPAEVGNWNARGGPTSAPALVRNLGASLDEFELFSRALGEAEIHHLYIEGKPEPDL